MCTDNFPNRLPVVEAMGTLARIRVASCNDDWPEELDGPYGDLANGTTSSSTEFAPATSGAQEVGAEWVPRGHPAHVVSVWVAVVQNPLCTQVSYVLRLHQPARQWSWRYRSRDCEEVAALEDPSEKAGNGWIMVSIPEAPGALSQGRTRAEARENVIDALHGILELRVGEHALTESAIDNEPLELKITA